MSNNAGSAEEDLLYCWEEYLKEMENEGRALGKEMEVTPKDLFFLSDRVRQNSTHGIRCEENYSFWSQREY